MAKILRVQLTEPPTPLLMHRFLNFSEDVYRDDSLKDECAMTLEEIDGPTGRFHLREIHKRFVRTAAARVREIAEKHHLLESIHVDEVPDG
jgi:hypothetical protein